MSLILGGNAIWMHPNYSDDVLQQALIGSGLHIYPASLLQDGYVPSHNAPILNICVANGE